MKVPSYKSKDGENGRSTILNHIKQLVTLLSNNRLLLQNDDALDTVLCILAGADFFMRTG